MSESIVIGIDVGGSHITAAAIRSGSHELMDSTRSYSSYDGKQTRENILKAWADVINAAINKNDKAKLKGLAFAIPGPFDYSKGIAKYKGVGKMDSLYNVHIPTALRPYLQFQDDVEFRFINDASAFAIGEASVGAAKGTKASVSITLGTGFGSAFIKDGVPVISGHLVPTQGCLWHLPFKNGIADDYISTRWFERESVERNKIKLKGVKHIAEMARINGNTMSLFEEFGSNLAVLLSPWLQRFEAEILVMGGQMVGAYDLFGPSFEMHMNIDCPNVKICKSSLMVDGAIIGSSLLFSETFWNKVKNELPTI